jgi:anthranilate phosphoribosyltransferase
VPTVFNFLGPLANPAGARRQVVGVGDPTMAELMIGALAELGSEHALVFHGHDGLDELTTTTTSAVWELQAGEVRSYVVDPEDLGIARSLPGDLTGGGPEWNAEITRDLLEGKTGPARDIVVLNAAAALVAAGVADGLADGIDAAGASLESGRAAECLERLVATSQAAKAEEEEEKEG